MLYNSIKRYCDVGAESGIKIEVDSNNVEVSPISEFPIIQK